MQRDSTLVQRDSMIALWSEQLLRPGLRALDGPDPPPGRSLLVRSTSAAFAASALRLLPCDTEGRWAQYEDQRVEVEAGFGLTEEAARSLVRSTRERGRRLGLRLWLATTPGPGPVVVGAIAAFPLPAPDQEVARLQEVDIFPAHRGKGLGRPLLEAIRRRLQAEGVQRLIIGADEADWPLAWYRRLGFRRVARVEMPGQAVGRTAPMYS